MAITNPEPLADRLKELFRHPRTRWDQIVRLAWIAVLLHLLAVLLTALIGWNWPGWLNQTAGAIFSVSLVIVSLWYGGMLTDFYTRLTGFGISDIRINRQGQDPEQTKMWMDRISGSKKISIVGTLSKGWFVQAAENLDAFLKSNGDVERFEVYLIDPLGDMAHALVESGSHKHADLIEEFLQVFRSVHRLATNHPKFKVHLYDTDPMSCVIAKGAIYLGLYLPRTSRQEIPEFTISAGSFLGDKIAESITKLQAAAPNVDPSTIDGYRNLLKKHSSTTREDFWDDPAVFCDFCKEPRRFPTAFSRRYPDFGDDRIIECSERFYVVPTLGQLVVDHALLIPRSHVTSSAALSEDAAVELVSLTEKWSKGQASGGTSLIFEHGVPSSGGSYGGCGICHCHVHLLSISQTLGEEIYDQLHQFLSAKGYSYETKTLVSWTNISAYRERPYLCVKIGDVPPIAFVFNEEERIASQLMRQFVASRLVKNGKNWNWRSTDGERDDLRASVTSLRTIFS